MSRQISSGVRRFVHSLATAAGAGLIGFSHAQDYSDGTLGAKGKGQISVTDAPFNANNKADAFAADAIQMAIDYAHSFPATRRPDIFVPPGRFLLDKPLQMYPDTVLRGVPRDTGYWFGFNHSSELIAGVPMAKMIDVTGSNICVGDLGLYANDMADYGLFTAGVFGRMSSLTIYNNAITLAKKSCIHLNNVGIAKIRNNQLSGFIHCGLDGSGFGDSEIHGNYINSGNVDSDSIVDGPSSAVVFGVGIRLRRDPGTGNQCANINISGGKGEFLRIGILINSAQGINISNVNFDTCRKASILIDSDVAPLPAEQKVFNVGISSSIQISTCRFLGGSKGVQAPTAHIIVRYARHVTITGCGFKYANDGAADFIGDASDQGPDYGIWLFNAELCTVVGNNLYGAARTNCLRVENVTPAAAQHTIFGNTEDGTALINPGSVAALSAYGNINFVSGAGAVANNTAKAWVRFNGNGPAPVIIDSHNVDDVNGAGGTYEVIGSINWGANAAVHVSARQWFGPADAATYGVVTANTAIVYSTSNGVLSGNGDITVTIFGQ